MSTAAVLFSAPLLSAALVYGLAAVVEAALEMRLRPRLERAALHWAWDHVLGPLARAALLVLFILAAYPALYGLADAPPLGTLLGGAQRVGHLLNTVFLLSLLLPALPLISRLPALVLPLQACIACALLWVWMRQAQGLPAAGLWPGLPVAGLLLLYAGFSHWVAARAAAAAGDWLDRRFDVLGCEELLARTGLLWLQLPAILLYSLSLPRG